MAACQRAEDECGGNYNFHIAPIVAGIGTRLCKPVYDPNLPECEATSKLYLRIDALCEDLIAKGLCPEMVNAVVPMTMDPSEENIARYTNLMATARKGREIFPPTV